MLTQIAFMPLARILWPQNTQAIAISITDSSGRPASWVHLRTL